MRRDSGVDCSKYTDMEYTKKCVKVDKGVSAGTVKLRSPEVLPKYTRVEAFVIPLSLAMYTM